MGVGLSQGDQALGIAGQSVGGRSTGTEHDGSNKPIIAVGRPRMNRTVCHGVPGLELGVYTPLVYRAGRVAIRTVQLARRCKKAVTGGVRQVQTKPEPGNFSGI